MGLHGQVICVWCSQVVREMTPEEKAHDRTWDYIFDPKVLLKIKNMFKPE